jgi:hypothetical protein
VPLGSVPLDGALLPVTVRVAESTETMVVGFNDPVAEVE